MRHLISMFFLLSLSSSVLATKITCSTVADLGELPFPYSQGLSFEITNNESGWAGPANYVEYELMKTIRFFYLSPEEVVLYSLKWKESASKGIWLRVLSTDHPRNSFLGIAHLDTYEPEHMNFPNSKLHFLVRNKEGITEYSGMSLRCSKI